MRQRASAVIYRGNAILLVRDFSRRNIKVPYSLPGGKIERGEDPASAAAREVREELGLRAKNAEYVGTYRSPYNEHHIVLLEVEGEPRINSREITRFKWWMPGDENTRVRPSVIGILRVLREASTNPVPEEIEVEEEVEPDLEFSEEDPMMEEEPSQSDYVVERPLPEMGRIRKHSRKDQPRQSYSTEFRSVL